MRALQLEALPAIHGYAIEWAGEDFYILSKRNELFYSRDLTPPFRSIGAIPSNLVLRLASRFRPFQRLARFLFYNVISLGSDRFFVTFQKSAGIFDKGHYIPIKGLLRPSRFLRGGCAVDKAGGIYFGEYLPNPQRGPMRVYYLAPNSTSLTVAYEFGASTIRHIHGLFYDPFEDSIWCTTGDLDEECNIIRTHDGFKTIETVGKGDESWRAVSLLFTQEAIFYGMDAEFRQNRLYRLDRATAERSQLAEVSGPIYYSRSVGDHLFFAVTAEGAPIQKDNAAVLWHVTPDGRAEEIARFSKDRMNNYFMPGTIHFPLGPGNNSALEFYCLGLMGNDQKSMRISLPA